MNRSLTRFLSLPALFAIALLTAAPGGAQPKAPPVPIPPDLSLIHLDTPAVPPKGGVGANLQIRAFGGDEGLVYTGIGIQYGFGNGLTGVLRGTLAGRKTHFLPGGGAAIRHGGNDLELAVRYQLTTDPRFAGLVGISFPDTAAQNNPVLTLGASAAFPVGKDATVYLNPKTVFIKDNVLLGLGIGGRARVSDAVSVTADVTPLLTGQNTRSTRGGDRERRAVYGIAVRIARPKDPLSFDIGYANGTGQTTGSSLTPGLGGSGAFYAAATLRR